MQFRVAIEGTDPYLLVRAEGAAALPQLRALAAFVSELCNHEAHCLVLADLSAVQPDLSFTDHLQFAMTVTALLKQVKVLAAVVPPGYLDAPAARAARLAGMNVGTFLDRQAAFTWLDAEAAATRSASLAGR